MSKRKQSGRRQLTLLDRLNPPPDGYVWSTVRAAGSCNACGDELVIGSQCLRRHAVRYCADCGTKDGASPLTEAPK